MKKRCSSGKKREDGFLEERVSEREEKRKKRERKRYDLMRQKKEGKPFLKERMK